MAKTTPVKKAAPDKAKKKVVRAVAAPAKSAAKTKVAVKAKTVASKTAKSKPAPAKKTAAPKVAPTKAAPKKVAAVSKKPVETQKNAKPLALAPTKSDKPSAPVKPTAAPTKLTTPTRASIARNSTHAPIVSPPASGAKASFTGFVNPMVADAAASRVKPLSLVKDPKLAHNWKKKDAAHLTDAEILAMPDAEYMNDKQLAFFRLKLQALKQSILESADETTEHLHEDAAIVPDPADRATIEEEHALELRTRDRERKLLKKIEQSIARIDANDYGYCDETGEAIGVGRLLARPTATLSLEAQQRRELKQKMFGD